MSTGERGETLLELVVAVTIMGLAVAAIVGGMATSIMMSDIHRQEARAGAAARGARPARSGTWSSRGPRERTSRRTWPGFASEPASGCWIRTRWRGMRSS